MKELNNKYGEWALITGASSGIGKEFATSISEKGLNVILVARSSEKLKKTAQELEKTFKVKTKVVVTDLATEKGIEKVIKETENLNIGLLVNNAGREDSNHFLKITPKEHLATIDLNVKVPMLLTHHFGKKMVERKKGGIINMSSIVGFQGVAHRAKDSGT